MSSSEDVLFGNIALSMHFIERPLLDRALTYQKVHEPLTPLGELLFKRGVLTREQVERVLERQRKIKSTMTRPVPNIPGESGPASSGGLVDSWQQYAPTPGSGAFSRPYPTPNPTPNPPVGTGNTSTQPIAAAGLAGLSPDPFGSGRIPRPQVAIPPGVTNPTGSARVTRPAAPADPADNLIGQSIGGCKIIEKIGEGGMGAIFRARHESLGKDVVVKILPPESAANPRTVERFRREARAAAQLEHPNIVQVLNHDQTERGLWYIIMQYVDGKNLEDTIQEKGKHTWKEAGRIVAEVARGLAAAHKAGVIHRDIKADNILITPSGLVKLADFGLAKDLNSDMKLTADGAMIRTPLYMAPEIGRVKEIDGRVDVYSLGVTFYYLLTGIQPFRAFPAIEILSAKAHDKLKPPEHLVADIPDPVRNVLGKMLEKDRDARYLDCDKLLRDLDALDRDFPVEAGTPTLWGEKGSRPPSASGGPGGSAPAAKSGKTSRRVSSVSSKKIPKVSKSSSKSEHLQPAYSAPVGGLSKGMLVALVALCLLIISLVVLLIKGF